MTSDTAPIAESAKAQASLRTPITLVLFADGTGNAFSQHETNIWRLYGALEKNTAH